MYAFPICLLAIVPVLGGCSFSAQALATVDTQGEPGVMALVEVGIPFMGG
ncbi:MAG: hypothetical protein ACI9MR_004412, partial [Myxococcota bacterium]